jgi:predicted TIM-barrel fold metal-dependent hydrolase
MGSEVKITRRAVLTALAGAPALAASGRSAAASTTIPKGIIDVHSHALLPVWVAAEAKARSGKPSGVFIPNPDWSVESHLRVMDTHGIAMSVLSLPRATVFVRGKPARDLARAMNEEFAAIIARYPTRFGAFAVLPLDDMEAMIAETTYALDTLKLPGIGVPTQIDGVYLGNASYDGWFEEMNRRATTLFVHPVPPPGFEAVDIGLNVAVLEYPFETTRVIANLMFSGARTRFANIKIICTHAGGTVPFLSHRIATLEPLYGAGRDRPTLPAQEIMSTLATFHYDLVASTGAAQLDVIRRLVPASQILMGFDYPMMPSDTIGSAMASFNSYAGLTPKEREMILRSNALTLLPQSHGA